MDEQVDRLSSLPNDVIHLILSFLDIKDAIQTMALSSRYRFIWTSLPYLNFSNEDFSTLNKFFKFVTRVLSRRDTKIEVYSLKLSYRGNISHVSVERILDYAFSHNVQQISVTYSYSSDNFPLSLLRSESIKRLTLSGARNRYIKLMSTWELPALTTLHLDCITFEEVFTDFFSKCLNLENVTLCNWYVHPCNTRGSTDYGISHPRLSNLTLINNGGYIYDLNVDAPQLKNLTVKDWSSVHLRSAPKLHSLVFKGYHILLNSPNGFCSLEKADLCFYEPDYKEDYETYAHKVVDILQKVSSVKYLTLNMETVELLISSFKELISHQPFSFANLTSIKAYPHDKRYMPDEMMPIEMNLPKSSSGATLTFEIIALRNAVLAENCMEKLWAILEEEKVNCEINMSRLDNHETHMLEKGEAQVENEKAQPVEKKALDIEGKMEKIDICLTDLGFQINKGIARTSCIFYRLREAETLLLEELHTSKRDKLEARFRSLQAEVDIVAKKIIDGTRIQFDEKQSHLSYCLHELAKQFQPSS